MKQLKFFSKIVLVGLLGFLLVNCQKDEAQNEAQLLTAKSQNESKQLKSASLPPDYLQDLITSINSMVENGDITKGEGQSLLAKVDNAIKSIEKGNTNAVNGQLGAFNSEVEYFVDNGTLTSEQGESLTDVADFVVDFPDGSFTDPRDGQKYSVVLIGDQVWLGENLKATTYNDGTAIPNVTSGPEWGVLSTGAYCWYYNDISNKPTYGALYNWYAVNTQKLAPTGWHVPTDTEWKSMIEYLGGTAIAGEKAKSIVGWEPNNGTNESGFSAVSAGIRDPAGTFAYMGIVGYTWSTFGIYFPAYNSWSGRFYCLFSENDKFSEGWNNARVGVSVRCIKN